MNTEIHQEATKLTNKIIDLLDKKYLIEDQSIEADIKMLGDDNSHLTNRQINKITNEKYTMKTDEFDNIRKLLFRFINLNL